MASLAMARLLRGRGIVAASTGTALIGFYAARPAFTTPESEASPKASETNTTGDAGSDLIRDGPVRDLAYARRMVQAFLVKGRAAAYTSDVGESVRPVVPSWFVRACYGMTWMYVFTDVSYHTADAYMAQKSKEVVCRTAVQSTVFQVIASVAVPSLIIHQVVHMGQRAVKSLPPGRIQFWLPSVIGLACIPFMPYVDEPIEHVIEMGFDKAWPVEGESGSAH